MKYPLAICAIVKNEHDYLLEWIAYHRVVGVNRFLIYNNCEKDDDGTTKLLKKLHRVGLIELVAWPDRPNWVLASGVHVRPQAPAYYDGTERLRGEAEWVAFIDADEFIVPMKEKDLPSTLKRYESFGGVGPNWRMFGSSGQQQKQNVPVMKRFTMASRRENAHNHHVKSISRPELIREVGTHRPFLEKGKFVDEHGREITDKRGIHHSVTYDFIRINHYFTKSREEWLQKIARGRAATPGQRPEDFFVKADLNDELDTFILQFYDATVNGMKELASAADIKNYPTLSGSQLLRKRRRSVGLSEPQKPQPPEKAERIVDVHLIGGFANRMIEYMVVRRIASEVEGCMISNAVLPDWGINHPAIPGGPGPETRVPTSPHQVDIAAIVESLCSTEKIRINFKSYAQWFPNFSPLEVCRRMFPENEHDYPGYGPEYLVCNVRGGEVLDARHRQYVLLPIEFYAELAKDTGLRLMFMGQIEDNTYCRALRRRFPDAEFHPTRGVVADFQIFRNSTHLVPSVSTFSWLAAWLSRGKSVILAVDGLFHPVQEPRIDLLPLADERYRFYLFPINYAVPVEQFEKAHHVVQDAGSWCAVDAAFLSKLRTVPQRKHLEPFVSRFDEEFYLRSYKDIARAVSTGGLKSGLEHYVKHGFAEGRDGFPFDPVWYSTEYALAAMEVGRGDYADLAHHYVEVGASRGYRPVPERSK
jgi:hypothetical protein